MAETISKKRASDAVALLMDIRGLDDAQVAIRVGLSRSSVQGKRAGGSFTLADIDRFSEALEVPPEVFLMESNGVWDWVNAHRPEWVREFTERAGRPRPRSPRSRCDATGGQQSIPFDEAISVPVDLTEPLEIQYFPPAEWIEGPNDPGDSDAFALAS